MSWPTNRLMAVDTETTGLEIYSPSVVATLASWWDSYDKGGCFRPDRIPEQFLRRITDSNWTKLFYNAKYDIPILAKAGVLVNGPVIDVMVMMQMAVPKEKPSDTHGLKHMSRRFLKDKYLEEEVIKKWCKANKKQKGEAPDRILHPYAVKDARNTISLFFFIKQWFDENGQWGVLEAEMRNTRVMLQMEEIGMLLDMEEVASQSIRLGKEGKKIRSKLSRLTGNPSFNPNSTDQVRAAVFDGTITATRRSRKTGKAQVNHLALIETPSDIGSAVLRWRKVSKAISTYLRNFASKSDPNNVIHPTLNQNGARTGRLSCSNPNLTNLPRPSEDDLGRIRCCFVAREGFRFVFVDFEQLEIRIQAHYTGEPHVLEAIRAGRDLHSETCKLIFNKREDDPDWKDWRYLAKKLNLAMQYGMGIPKFRDTVLKDTDGAVRLTLVESTRYVNDYKAAHPKLAEFFLLVADEVARTGGVVNEYGRFMPVDRRATYKGVNYKIQGSAADLVKGRMRLVYLKQKREHTLSRMVMQIHDELMFEIHRTEKHLPAQLAQLMEEHEKFQVPLTVSTEWGQSWGTKRELFLDS